MRMSNSGTRHGLRCLEVLLISGGCLHSSPAFAQECIDSTYHLTGDSVKRRPRTPMFVDYDYILLRGERADGRCRYQSPPWGQYASERIVSPTIYTVCRFVHAVFFLAVQRCRPARI